MMWGAFWKRLNPPESAEDKNNAMFQISVEETFSSGHALRGYRGKCENVHGHNYRVQVTLQGPQLDNIGLLVDFTELKRALRGIISGLDHQFLNDLEAFKTVNPSAENLAKYFYDEMQRQLTSLPAGAGISEVTVWETDTSSAQFRPGK
jgi:6-pyruvoyltetrahydropterin/6-carboxytetrahydropterin synthase